MQILGKNYRPASCDAIVIKWQHSDENYGTMGFLLSDRVPINLYTLLYWASFRSQKPITRAG